MDRPAGAAAQEPAIEVTPEMIEAGAKVLLTSGDECLRQLGWISAELTRLIRLRSAQMALWDGTMEVVETSTGQPLY